MDIVLIRHPAPAIAGGMCYGQLDVPVAQPCAPAENTIRSMLLQLVDQGKLAASPTRWFSSPAQRCMWLAERLTEQAVQSVDALRELNFGRWEGMSWDAVPRAELDAWAVDLMGYCGHGGESAFAMRERLNAWRVSLSQRPTAHAAIALVTHAGVIRQLTSLWLNEPLENLLDRPIAYGAICAIRLGPQRAEVRAWNEVSE